MCCLQTALGALRLFDSTRPECFSFSSKLSSLEAGAAAGCELCRLCRQALLYQCAKVNEAENLWQNSWPVKMAVTEATGTVRLWIQDPARCVSCPPRVLVGALFSTVMKMPGVKPQLPNI